MRFDALEYRIEKLEMKQYDTKPIWEQALAAITETNQRLQAFDKRFDVIDERFDVIDERFDKIDARFVTIDQRFDKIDPEV